MTKRSAGQKIHKCSHGNIMANDAKAPVCTEYSHDMGSSPCLIEASFSQITYIFNQPESIESTPLSWAQTRVLAKGGALSMEVVNHHTGSQRDEKGLKYKVNNKHDGQMEFIVALQTLTHWQLAFGTHWYPIMCLHVSTERMVWQALLALFHLCLTSLDMFSHQHQLFVSCSPPGGRDGMSVHVPLKSIQAGCVQLKWLNAMPQCLWLPMMATLLHGRFDSSDFMDY